MAFIVRGARRKRPTAIFSSRDLGVDGLDVTLPDPSLSRRQDDARGERSIDSPTDATRLARLGGVLSFDPAGGMSPGDDELRAGIAANPVVVPDSITIDGGEIARGNPKTVDKPRSRMQLNRERTIS